MCIHTSVFLYHLLQSFQIELYEKVHSIKDKQIILHERNPSTSHLILESNEIYNLTKQGLNAA